MINPMLAKHHVSLSSKLPKAIVTDGGGIFYSLRALAMYNALDICKERIDPGQPSG